MILSNLAASAKLQGLFQFQLEHELLRVHGFEGDLRFASSAEITLTAVDDTVFAGRFAGLVESPSPEYSGYAAGTLFLTLPHGLDGPIAEAQLSVRLTVFPGLRVEQ